MYKKLSTVIVVTVIAMGLTSCKKENTTEESSNTTILLSSGQQASAVISQYTLPDNLDSDVYEPYFRPYSHNGIVYFPNDNINSLLAFNAVPDSNLPEPIFIVSQINDVRITGSVAANNSQFFVENAGISVFNNPITSGGQLTSAFKLGGGDFSECSNQLRFSDDISVSENHLVVANTNRVLIWNLPIIANNQPADIVLGQNSFTSCVANDDNQDGVADAKPTARTLDNTEAVWTDGKRLIIQDNNNNRVLIWNSFPNQNFQPADVVLGQASFTTNTENDTNQDGQPDQNIDNRVLSFGYSQFNANSEQICVPDNNNDRVLIWNNFPKNNFTPADVVLEASNPSSCAFVDDSLIVGDYGNERFLIFKDQK
ncbi:hypothetical protein [Pelagibaculum spongiae]|uniref:Uncharacterized protein n=1 Tax=Pelagibaculum spongiae TaxID=2080658 RepID=A0A2V1GTH3_9GAMM|nr:hypothetical protein [Pelagibaculum spongiae]PVZ68314.1 hypothetical protein DC094_13590 [Pelagibaculum spongiae]